MGFKRKPYLLTWEDGPWEGLEVRVRGTSIDELKEITSAYEAAAGGDGKKDGKAFGMALTDTALSMCEQALISWNFEDEDGAPIPISEFRHQDIGMLTAIMTAWQGVLGNVPAPLPKGSPSGEKSPEVLIPMEIPLSSH